MSMVFGCYIDMHFFADHPYSFWLCVIEYLNGSFRYIFDDERVTKEDIKRALQEQYGGEEEVFFIYSLLLLVMV